MDLHGNDIELPEKILRYSHPTGKYRFGGKWETLLNGSGGFIVRPYLIHLNFQIKKRWCGISGLLSTIPKAESFRRWRIFSFLHLIFYFDTNRIEDAKMAMVHDLSFSVSIILPVHA
jgi:hypothetical protein